MGSNLGFPFGLYLFIFFGDLLLDTRPGLANHHRNSETVMEKRRKRL